MTLHEIKSEPDPSVIKVLENRLDDARAGRVRGFVMVSQNDDGTFTTAYPGNFDVPTLMWSLVTLVQDIYHAQEADPITDTNGEDPNDGA